MEPETDHTHLEGLRWDLAETRELLAEADADDRRSRAQLRREIALIERMIAAEEGA